MGFASRISLFVYRALTALLAPAGAAFLCFKRRRDPPYGRRIFELLGFYKQRLEHCVWFHASSFGEVTAIRPLIGKFRKRYPAAQIVLTTMTTTGMSAARPLDGILQLFVPLDSPCAVRRFFRRFNPRLLVILETELWPNLLCCARKHGCEVVIVNGRMQKKNLRNYLKCKAVVSDLLARPLSKVICVSREDALRFETIGVAPDKITVAGNIKYDLLMDAAVFDRSRAIKSLFSAPALCCASIHRGEEQYCLEAFKMLRLSIPGLKLIVVPRHSSDTQALLRALDTEKFSFRRKSLIADSWEYADCDIVIGDTLGEISFYFGLSDLVFMGGSFVPVGGHNPLEAAFFALPTLTGPIYHNFKEQFASLISEGAAFKVSDARELADAALALLNAPQRLQDAGHRSLAVLKRGRGSLDRVMTELSLLLSD